MLYLLIFYFIFLIGFVAYSAAGVYHLCRFGYIGDLTKPVMMIYSFLSIVIVLASLLIISIRDWPIGL